MCIHTINLPFNQEQIQKVWLGANEGAWGRHAEVERRRRELNRSCGPFPNFFSIFELKKASFGAFLD